jgi:DNA polymerase III alpha subunit
MDDGSRKLKRIGDIDIDVKPTFNSEVFNWTRASIYDQEKMELKPHPVGYHPQEIPQFLNLSAIPYEQAEDEGFAKVDFLTLNLYAHVLDRAELVKFVNTEPDWDLLLDKNVQPKLFQLHKHGELLDSLKPKSINDIAELLALVRPGKRKLLGLYEKSKELVEDMLWEDSGNGYHFKKSHAICYAMVIQVQLHLFKTGKI